jgi:hypothetical protein
MNTKRRVLALGAVLIASGLSAQAQAPEAGAAALAPRPIPTLRCEFKAMSACAPDGDCKEGDQVAGIKIPVRVTVDFENSVVAAVDEGGFARADKFDSVAESADQLIMHGIDGAYGWQLLISKTSNATSMSFATADSIISGFGTCSNK